MAAALASAGDAIAALQAAPTAEAASAALQTVEALRAVTVEHLDHEEIELEPVFEAKKDTPQIKAMGRAFAKVSPTVGGNFFAWVENGASPRRARRAAGQRPWAGRHHPQRGVRPVLPSHDRAGLADIAITAIPPHVQCLRLAEDQAARAVVVLRVQPQAGELDQRLDG